MLIDGMCHNVAPVIPVDDSQVLSYGTLKPDQDVTPGRNFSYNPHPEYNFISPSLREELADHRPLTLVHVTILDPAPVTIISSSPDPSHLQTSGVLSRQDPLEGTIDYEEAVTIKPDNPTLSGCNIPSSVRADFYSLSPSHILDDVQFPGLGSGLDAITSEEQTRNIVAQDSNPIEKIKVVEIPAVTSLSLGSGGMSALEISDTRAKFSPSLSSLVTSPTLKSTEKGRPAAREPSEPRASQPPPPAFATLLYSGDTPFVETFVKAKSEMVVGEESRESNSNGSWIMVVQGYIERLKSLVGRVIGRWKDVRERAFGGWQWKSGCPV